MARLSRAEKKDRLLGMFVGAVEGLHGQYGFTVEDLVALVKTTAHEIQPLRRG